MERNMSLATDANKNYNTFTHVLFGDSVNNDITEYQESTATPDVKKDISAYRDDVFDSIKLNDKIKFDTTVLKNNEQLDLFMPSKKIAVDFDGVYTNSELNVKGKHYHLGRTKQCSSSGVQLLHIFETEWVEKNAIVKSIINAKLGVFEKRIFARKCDVRQLESSVKNSFLDKNHLQGSDKSSIKLGLFFNNELVSVMTFGVSRYNKKYQYEIHRFCNKLNHQIIGGASKLLNAFHKSHNPTSIITYSDMRYSDGKFYEKLGFTKTGVSNPNYFYFKNSLKLMSRVQFQKHKLHEKLDIFDESLTEWDNMKINGYDRIWDCGNIIYVWEK